MNGALRSEFTDAELSPGLLLWQVTNACKQPSAPRCAAASGR